MAQSLAAHQTASAMIKLYEIIVEKNHQWKVRLSNSPYDELVLEVKEKLAEDYKEIVENVMIKEGNKWLTSNIINMKADSIIGKTWGECH